MIREVRSSLMVLRSSSDRHIFAVQEAPSLQMTVPCREIKSPFFEKKEFIRDP
jgi:hypothetical protein